MTNTRALLPLSLLAAAFVLLAALSLPTLQLPKAAPQPHQVNAPSLAHSTRLHLSALRTGLMYQQLPPLSDHAKLHAEATYVWNWLNLHETRGCRWSCPDGRTRYLCHDGEHWLFAVISTVGDTVITAFYADQEYGVGHTRDYGCKNPFHPAHP